MPSWKFNFPSTDERSVEAFERQIGARLPDEYRHFLLRINGGEPVEGFFEVAGWGSTVVHIFYGLDTGHAGYNLDRNHAVFRHVASEGFIPIACDPGGYIVFLGVKDPWSGKLYFWDRGETLDELVALSPSFETFLASLRPVPTPIHPSPDERHPF